MRATGVPADAGTIHAAIDASESGTVIVAPGVYRENLRFNGKRVEVRSSHGPLATVIDGGAADDAVVTFQAKETRASVLRGFTVRNGRQGGIRMTNASPTVVDNIVTANSAYDGAGIYMAGSSARVQNNLIRGNADRGGGPGAGMYLVQTYGAEVVGNTFESNKATYWGGGMALWTSEHVLILNNVFRGNRAGHEGGAMYIVNYSDPLVSQNVFVDNEAGYRGGAISITVPYTYQGATSVNNTMAANRAPKGSAITGTGDYLAVNNIMSGPPTGEVLFCDGTAGRLFYNDVYNGTASPSRWCPDTTGLVGNVSVDPRLAPDLSRAAGSPVIDAGHDDPLLPLLRPTDANGTDRCRTATATVSRSSTWAPTNGPGRAWRHRPRVQPPTTRSLPLASSTPAPASALRPPPWGRVVRGSSRSPVEEACRPPA